MSHDMSTEEDPIVICGMGCRLPGEVKSPSQFWDLIISGRSAQSDVPSNRFDVSKWQHPDPKRPGGILPSGGYFLSHDDLYRNFDPSFFGISSLEATSMDPQQRKLLEVVYETFESAGVTLRQASGSQTACYVGAFTADFAKTIQRDPEDYTPYQSTGTDMTILSNRVNYVFNLKGPSLTVDTACSSSLYALHLACQGLLLGDFDAAVVAGTSIIMDVLHQATATKLGILSPRSTCHTFDESADGFGRADGIAALYIKRMSDAVADGDPIRAVIRATTINTNGRGVGISHPGVQGQEAVIRQAYKKARLPFHETGYLECHGTGTPVGDPIEVAAAGNVFATDRTADAPILLSSVKSQIGHTEGASGVAAVQKVVMALENGVVPATIGIKKLNPALDLKDGRIKIVKEHLKWPEGYRRAGVNSFGYGGANAHVIVDSVSSYFDRRKAQLFRPWTSITIEARSDQPTQLLVASANSGPSLQQNIGSVSHLVRKLNFPDLAHTLFSKRTHFHHRAFAIANPSSTPTLAPASWVTATQRSSSPRIAFVFTGQGAQWPQMGLSLLSCFPVARDTLNSLQHAMDTVPLADQPPWTLLSALSSPPENSLMMTDVTVTVTLCTALQIILVDLLRSFSVAPIAVVGHSSGEAAAAYASGLLTASEAIITSYYRALSLQRSPNPGAMMAVGLGAKDVLKYLPEGKEVYVGCHNSPQSVTLSGRVNVIDQLEVMLKKEGVFARKVKSSGFANHSPLVEGAAEYFRTHFQGSLPASNIMSGRTKQRRARMYSCITAGQVGADDVGVDYWSQNISAPVLFDEALQELIISEKEIDCLLEIGPHSALAGPIRQVKNLLGLDNERMMYLPSLVRGSDGIEDMLKLAGQLYLTGYPVDLEAVNAAARHPDETKPKFIVDLPGYQWTYDQIHWMESRVSRELLWRKHPRHDLLGSRSANTTPQTVVWRNKLLLINVPWIKDHRIGSSVLVPASAYVAMAVEACRQCTADKGVKVEGGKFILEDMSILAAIRLEEKDRGAVETIFELSIGGEGKKRFTISSVTIDGQWTEHATGYISYQSGGHPRLMKQEPEGILGTTRSSELYIQLSKLGLNYGPCFRTLGDISQMENGSAKTNIDINPSRGTMISESSYIVHPATMDGCFQLAFAAVLDTSQSVQRSYLPSSIPKMTIWNNDESVENGQDEALVEGGAIVCGLRTVEADFSLTRRGRVVVEGEVKFVAVEGLLGAAQEEIMPEPYQSLSWYPDVEMLECNVEIHDLLAIGNRTTESVVKSTPNGHIEKPTETTTIRCLTKLIELLTFKRPRSALVEVGGTVESNRAILNAVKADRRFPAAQSLIMIDARGNRSDVLPGHNKSLNPAGRESVDFGSALTEQGFMEESLDVLVLMQLPENCSLADVLLAFEKTLRQDANIIIAGHALQESYTATVLRDAYDESAWKERLRIQGQAVILVRSTDKMTNGVKAHEENSLYILRDTQSKILEDFEAYAKDADFITKKVSLANVDVLPKGATVLSLLEAEEPFMSNVSDAQLQNLKVVFKRAARVYWMTSGDDPRMILMQGMAKTLRAEYPGLQLINIHADNETCDVAQVASLAWGVITRDQRISEIIEPSILLRDAQVWISRYIVDEERNTDDLARSKGIMMKGPFEGQLQLDIKKIGQLESFFFRQKTGTRSLGKGFVRVRAVAFALSKENAMTLKGMNFGKDFSDECVGMVTEVGGQSQLQNGDIVLTLAGSRIESEMIVPETACLKCASESQALQLLGFGTPFLRAFIALIKVGRTRRGDVVVLNSEDEVLKTAISILVENCGAKLGDLSGEEQIDLIIDDLRETVLERLQGKLALGAKILILESKRPSAGEPRQHSDSLPISFVDVMAIARKRPSVMTEALSLMAHLHQTGRLLEKPVIKLFDMGELSDAVVTALECKNDARIVMRGREDTRVPVHHMKRSEAKFAPHGAYLLIGCLGGLGRSIATWMVEHGARNLVFLSRSGADKPEAAAFVRELENLRDVTVTVVRGDVCKRADVRRAVREANCQIRGVIQASTVYDDTRFEQMTRDTWKYMLQPKMEGTWNLHLETSGQPLDFFVMTSSSIGLLGATTQTHYAAANAFLDSMARYRRQQGLPGTALSLGMVTGVGRFHEDQALEEVLQKRGAYPINEAELLRMMEQACFSSHEGDARFGVLDTSTLITAIDPTRFLNFQTMPEWVQNDCRFSHINNSVKRGQPNQTTNSDSNNDTVSQLRKLRGSEKAPRIRILELIRQCILEKLSSLLATPVEKLKDSLQRPLSDLGMDSIVGTELQAWLWRELQVSLDFMELFASQRNLNGFIELVVDKWEEK